MINVRPLCHTPEATPGIAGWIWNAFWADGEGRGYSEAEIEALLRLTREDSLPMAWVAWHKDTPVGCVNLVENDDPGRPHLRPWLAGLYVEPAFRKQGVASALIKQVLATATELGETQCYLGTDIPAFYSAKGASVIEHEPEPNFYVMGFTLKHQGTG